MLHTPIITRESVIEAHRQRRARMAEKAVPDDGIIHPLQRRRKFVRRYEAVLPQFSFAAFFDRANRMHPLPKPFKAPILSEIECASIERGEELIFDRMSDLPALPKSFPSVAEIQRAVCEHFNIGILDLISERRTANLVLPRQIAMYLAKVLTPRSYPDIGRRFGGRDHTTALHAFRKIDDLLARDEALAETIATIREKLSETVGSPALACARG
jgi:hypothetical protein